MLKSTWPCISLKYLTWLTRATLLSHETIHIAIAGNGRQKRAPTIKLEGVRKI